MEPLFPASGRARWCILPLALLTIAATAASRPTALERYVALPDPNYHYSLEATIPGNGYTSYILNLTSQQWRSASEDDHPIWKHWLTIVRPDAVASTTGFLFINGGSNGSAAPVRPDPLIVSLAMSSGSVAAELSQIPNQPLVFAGSGKKLTEDAIIAFRWEKYSMGVTTAGRSFTHDESRRPRARYLRSLPRLRPADQVTVTRFVVTGGSKRGWTTWTTAIVDPRVVAITPVVIDMLNVETSFIHHCRVYGFWAPAVADYVEHASHGRQGSRLYRDLMRIVEPYRYRDRLVSRNTSSIPPVTSSSFRTRRSSTGARSKEKNISATFPMRTTHSPVPTSKRASWLFTIPSSQARPARISPGNSIGTAPFA